MIAVNAAKKQLVLLKIFPVPGLPSCRRHSHLFFETRFYGDFGISYAISRRFHELVR